MPNPRLSATLRAELLGVLNDSRALGFLGPGPLESHIEHALGFAVESLKSPSRALDLGSGGGVPGLVLACLWPEARWFLLDSMHKRCVFLKEAIERLNLAGTAQVMEGRAEELAHRPELRDTFDLVTARSFGPPAVTAECAVGFLKVGGYLVVSEPPENRDRWGEYGLKMFGMKLLESGRVAVVEKVSQVSEDYPRRVGVPAKRPLF